jgi:hypothetical protein
VRYSRHLANEIKYDLYDDIGIHGL